MTYQNNFTLPTEIMEQIAEHGLEYLPELIQTILNPAMKIEHQKHLRVDRYERIDEQQGHAAMLIAVGVDLSGHPFPQFSVLPCFYCDNVTFNKR